MKCDEENQYTIVVHEFLRVIKFYKSKNNSMKTNYKRGFTLIELLVVIAIIGILASIILASLATARGKGSDATVKSDINSIQTESELAANGSDYTPVCATDATVLKALKGIVSVGPATAYSIAIATPSSGTNVACHSNTTGWAVEAPLNAGSSWCVDYTGAASTTSTMLAANAIVCS